MSSVPKKSILDTLTQKIVESQVWRSLFRHGYPDTPLNQSLVMMGNVFLHLHPVKVSRQAMKITYTWCMGGISFFLFLLLTITGVFLMFYYVPDTSTAYVNIQQLSTVVSFGHLVRNMHRWAAHLMVVSVTLHMIRVFYHGAYKPPREFNWVVGVLLFFVTLFLSFTGYLLPWDQIAIWAITVGTNLAPYTPLLGSTVYKILVGGSSVGQATLIRFYVGHVILLPLAGALLMAVHFWRIRKDGGEAGPPPPSRRELEARAERERERTAVSAGSQQ
ncbi:MAG TPA: selenite/tellurite reduction operon b-type cytochrome ExtP [Ktedonobacteraceae bacterium]|nr:selenite/tellurite reduction operon b-type cytochrome ExtP [Ktedonobacteraceae bacterium]